jgi:type IV secretory pathway TrbD component
MTLCCAVVAAVINLRLDVWAAAGYGVSVAEIHNLLPMWIVPMLSLVVVIWTGVILTLTNPKHRLRQE